MEGSKKCMTIRSLSIILLILLSACSTSKTLVSQKAGIDSKNGNSAQVAISPSPAKSQSPAEILHASAVAMKQLQSVHFVLSGNEKEAASSSAVSRTSPTTNAEVDEVLPDQIRASLSLPNETGKIAEISAGEQVYIQTRQGKWYAFKVSEETTNCLSLLPLTSYANPLATFLPLTENGNFTDHGTENLGGQSLRHITMTLSDNAIEALINLKLAPSIFDGPTHRTLTKLDYATLDAWVDEATSYVHHLTIQANTSYDASQLLGKPAGSAIRNFAMGLTMDFSQFNQFSSIPIPADATPYLATSAPAISGLCPFQLDQVINPA